MNPPCLLFGSSRWRRLGGPGGPGWLRECVFGLGSKGTSVSWLCAWVQIIVFVCVCVCVLLLLLYPRLCMCASLRAGSWLFDSLCVLSLTVNVFHWVYFKRASTHWDSDPDESHLVISLHFKNHPSPPPFSTPTHNLFFRQIKSTAEHKQGPHLNPSVIWKNPGQITRDRIKWVISFICLISNINIWAGFE